MAKKKAVIARLARAAEPLYREIQAVLGAARAGAYRAVNAAMVQAYWHVGRLIVEHEQGGARRAAYGEAVLDDLSRRLTAEFGRGFDVTNLRKMRQFYRMFAIRDAVRLESGGRKRDPLRLVSGVEPMRHMVREEMTWSHYRLLMQVEDPAAREWYPHEVANQHWSTRQLDRQISVLYYERLLTSRKKAPVRKEARSKLAEVTPEQFIRDPYVLEFLDLKDYPALRESAVVRVFDAHVRPKGDNPTIGLILCSKRNQAIARYSVLSEGKRLFAVKYMKVLPSETELRHEIERGRRMIEGRRPRAARGKD